MMVAVSPRRRRRPHVVALLRRGFTRGCAAMRTSHALRLHIGAADPLAYAPAVRAFFGTASWIHLYSPGETPGGGGHPARRVAGRLLRLVSGAARARAAAAERRIAEARRGWIYLPFWLGERGHLPFKDGAFGFALSEHLLEHLFLDEGFRLMQEVRRVLAPGGVFRVSVPDADLRPAPIEPLAFHAGRGRTSHDPGRWNDPSVHKTRWNIYGLRLMLDLAGFEVAPLRAFDRQGASVGAWPERGRPPYPDSADWESLTRSDYLRRPDSLIVDAIARTARRP